MTSGRTQALPKRYPAANPVQRTAVHEHRERRRDLALVLLSQLRVVIEENAGRHLRIPPEESEPLNDDESLRTRNNVDGVEPLRESKHSVPVTAALKRSLRHAEHHAKPAFRIARPLLLGDCECAGEIASRMTFINPGLVREVEEAMLGYFPRDQAFPVINGFRDELRTSTKPTAPPSRCLLENDTTNQIAVNRSHHDVRRLMNSDTFPRINQVDRTVLIHQRILAERGRLVDQVPAQSCCLRRGRLPATMREMSSPKDPPIVCIELTTDEIRRGIQSANDRKDYVIDKWRLSEKTTMFQETGAFAEIAAARWAKESGIDPVDAQFTILTDKALKGPDILLGPPRVAVDVKGHEFTEEDYCYPESQVDNLTTKGIEVVLWCRVSTRATGWETTEARVEIVAWSSADEISSGSLFQPPDKEYTLRRATTHNPLAMLVTKSKLPSKPAPTK